MTKKLQWLGIFFTLAVVVGSGYNLFDKTQASSPMSQQQAIDEGLQYLRDEGPQVCGDALTPAVHQTTGAEHTFNSTCIPAGWEPN